MASRLTPKERWSLALVAGDFLPTLNTETPVTDLKPNESPDCYGLDLSVDGKIGKGTIPSGEARIEYSVTLSTVPYVWAYERLWNITGLTASGTSNILQYGALKYDTIYYPQRSGRIAFLEDAQPCLAVIPFGQDNLFVPKTTGSYVVGNCLDTRALFQKGPILQELQCPSATRATELNDRIYVSNDNGLFETAGGPVKELTRNVRTDLAALSFQDLALTVDYEKQRIIGGTSMVFDTQNENLYRFNGSQFRFTTRQHHLPNYAPFAADRIGFLVEFADTDQGQLKYQLKHDDHDWLEEQTIQLRPDGENVQTWVWDEVPNLRNSSRLQVRVTDITASKYFKAIVIDQASANLDDFGD